MIKKIIIGVVSVIFTAGLMFGILYFIKQTQTSQAQDTAVPTIILDHSKDYGACELLDIEFIKESLGSPANNLQDPEDMGITPNKAIGEGVDNLESDSQRCIYAFSEGGTLENAYNSGDALTIERIVYTNESGPKALIEQVKANSVAIAVEGLGDAAFYDATPKANGPNAIYTFKLETFVNKTSVRYIIRQPAELVSFTAETAKTALIKLAKETKQP